MIPLLRVIIDSCDEEGCDHDNRHSIVSLLQHRNGKDGNDERTCSELSSIEIKPTLPNAPVNDYYGTICVVGRAGLWLHSFTDT